MMIGQVYVSESCPIPLRGQVVPAYFLGTYFSFILAHTSSLVFAYNLPVMFGLGCLPTTFQLIFMLLTQKESPAFLGSTGRMLEAQAVVERFYSLTNASDKAT